MAGELRGAETIAAVVRAQIARGVDVIKVGASERAGLASTDPRRSELTEDEMRAAVMAARAAGTPRRGTRARHGGRARGRPRRRAQRRARDVRRRRDAGRDAAAGDLLRADARRDEPARRSARHQRRRRGPAGADLPHDGAAARGRPPGEGARDRDCCRDRRQLRGRRRHGTHSRGARHRADGAGLRLHAARSHHRRDGAPARRPSTSRDGQARSRQASRPTSSCSTGTRSRISRRCSSRCWSSPTAGSSSIGCTETVATVGPARRAGLHRGPRRRPYRLRPVRW